MEKTNKCVAIRKEYADQGLCYCNDQHDCSFYFAADGKKCVHWKEVGDDMLYGYCMSAEAVEDARKGAVELKQPEVERKSLAKIYGKKMDFLKSILGVVACVALALLLGGIITIFFAKGAGLLLFTLAGCGAWLFFRGMYKIAFYNTWVAAYERRWQMEIPNIFNKPLDDGKRILFKLFKED